MPLATELEKEFYTYQEVADMLGVTRQRVINMCNGASEFPLRSQRANPHSTSKTALRVISREALAEFLKKRNASVVPVAHSDTFVASPECTGPRGQNARGPVERGCDETLS